MINLALRRVNIFRYILIGFKGSPSKANDPARKIMNGEHYTATESVIKFPFIIPDSKPCFFEVLFLVSVGRCFTGQRVPFIRRIAKLKLLDNIIRRR